MSFLLWNIKEDILKNVGNQTVLAPIDFHCIVKKKTLTFFQSIFFYVPQKAESHTGLEELSL